MTYNHPKPGRPQTNRLAGDQVTVEDSMKPVPPPPRPVRPVIGEHQCVAPDCVRRKIMWGLCEAHWMTHRGLATRWP